jgi:hypothetical protein
VVLFVAGVSQFLLPGVRNLTRAAAPEAPGVLVRT